MSSRVKFILPPQGIFQPNGPGDPVNYYYKPLVGRLYRRRIQAGLDLLTGPYEQILEFGYGGGLLLPTLSRLAKEIHAIDMETDAAIAAEALSKMETRAHLFRGDITRMELPKAGLDLIVAFSVFEHISDPAGILKCMHDLLRPGGELLVGMPMVSRWMECFFPLVGFHNISHHHVKNHWDFIKDAETWFSLRRMVQMPGWLPSFMSVYFNMIFQKKPV